MKNSEWCEKMKDNARDGEEAYHYYQLAEMWKKREKENEKVKENN